MVPRSASPSACPQPQVAREGALTRVRYRRGQRVSPRRQTGQSFARDRTVADRTARLAPRVPAVASHSRAASSERRLDHKDAL